MIRLFNVYYPTRTIVLLITEAIIVSGCFLLATTFVLGPDTYIALNYEYGALKIITLTALTLLFSYYFDLYEPSRISERWEIYFRLLLVLGFLSFLLSAVTWIYPEADIAHSVILLGLAFLTGALVIWRMAYEWIIARPVFRERVFVLGSGERARGIVDLISSRRDIGMEIVAWEGGINGEAPASRDEFATELSHFRDEKGKLTINRIVIAMQDRRGSLPVRELLKLRFDGVIIEDACDLLERLSGKMLLDGLRPSNFIYSEGFRVKPSQQIARRFASTVAAAVGLLLFAPFFAVCDAGGATLFEGADLLQTDTCRDGRQAVRGRQVSHHAHGRGGLRGQVGQ